MVTMAKPVTTPKAPKKKPVAAPGGVTVELPGELRQLAEIRAKFPPLSHDVSEHMLAPHDDESCRERGNNTRGADVFRGAMGWARTFGEHSTESGVSAVRVRWFLDCLTTLGALLMGGTPAKNPSDESAYDDAAKAADKLIARTRRRLYDAAGTTKKWRAAVDAALVPDEKLDARVSRLTGLAALIQKWLGAPKSPPLAANDITAQTVTALLAAAKTLEDAIATKPAAAQADRDSPAVNTAEWHLLFAMRPMWDDLAEAREDGLTSLQLTVTPALLRGLDLVQRKKKPATK